MSASPFTEFLAKGIDRGGFAVDDALAAVLPLMREIVTLHQSGLVAPLRGLSGIRVEEERLLRLVYPEGLPPRHEHGRIREIQTPRSAGLEVISHRRDDIGEDDRTRVSNLEVAAADEEIQRPVYLPGHVSWEHLVGHHDPLTDIFSLGMLLASLVTGLDFTEQGDLETFANSRGNLFALVQRLHPVVAVVIAETTVTNRANRPQDLASIVRTLETYRDQPVDTDVNQLPGLEKASKVGRRRMIQLHLRDRLFDVSRRNRLLYFKNSQSTLNLTTSSVPLLLDVRNIQPEQLFYWHPALAEQVLSGRPLGLRKWLRLEEAPYLPGQLDKLISEARRSRAEFGFSQLRMVIAFLRWNNLKEDAHERIHSPLLLLPVELARKKGVKDQYQLETQGTEAEVNPALRHYLKQLYDLDLPASIDLRGTSPIAFHGKIRSLIHASEPGVSLALLDKPRISLIHQTAKLRLDQYKRRIARQARAVGKAPKVDYSYDRSDFRPLGLQMFQKLIQPSPLPLRDLASAPPAPRTPFIIPPEQTTERSLYTLVEDAEGNPYSWEMDLCSLTLANFNYRKMTLVRDYANLIDHDTPNPAFDRVFSIEPKSIEEAAPAPLPPSAQHLIIAADATQIGAIAKARGGESLIIQGPPGTGKSQTITNLLADYVARGKRVLFVCEKRAAIDVVFHRLRQQGLDELCCLIHDSQTDKKEFILNLKQTYEQWLAGESRDAGHLPERVAALRVLETELATLESFAARMNLATETSALPLRDLYHRLIELRGSADGEACPDLDARTLESLPHYADWQAHAEPILRLTELLQESGSYATFSQHPLRWLGDAVITRESPLEDLAGRLDRAESALDRLEEALAETGLPVEYRDTLGEVSRLLEFAERLVPISNRNLLDLLDSGSIRARAFTSLRGRFQEKSKAMEAARGKTVHWIDKLSAEDTANALAITPDFQGILRFLKPGWWRLNKVMKARYDFSKHAVPPTWTRLLEDLAAEHALAADLAGLREEAGREFGTEDPGQLAEELAVITAGDAPPEVIVWRERLKSAGQDAAPVKTLAALAEEFRALRAELGALVFQAETHRLEDIASFLRDIREEADALPELLPVLRDLAAAPEKIRRAVRELPFTVSQLEAACGRKTLDQLYHEDRPLQRFDSHLLRQKLERMAGAHHQWLEHNAAWIRGQVRQRFTDHLKIANQSLAALSEAHKAFKKSYTTGRRELEHEFGKTMRYKSIRDLAAGDSGQVVRDLKPIWLMSPLSVSDTLPMETGLFDVVIFDEASQIPVEDAIPAAYRAAQVIVVGDEMQLPPTSFFSNSTEADDELTLEEEGESISVSMDADSFLTQCARNLPSTLLAWHYRSRHESLISFSNAAFYGGELYTIPDRRLASTEGDDLRVDGPDEAEALVPRVLSRPVSFIHCPGAIYDDRRNITEAEIIARMVRGILRSGSTLSIGIAAFSEAQQGQIEQALDALAATDPEFATLLEAEYVREEDDQFCGLFVKNLENVQGDERDIILMSVCYGPDAAGRMRMNFGPINQRGGEKRLNVIFSRARHHMVLVSTIRHTQITNDYNDGARALKNFLLYAESLSQGQAAMARQVLDGLNPLKRISLERTAAGGLVAGQIAEALAGRGWSVETGTGQSRFRSDVSVRTPGAALHQLSILVESGDTAAVLERFLTRPAILRAFGWQVVIVTAKDWWHEPAAVLERIERVLRREIADLEPERRIEAIEEQPRVASVAEFPPSLPSPPTFSSPPAIVAAGSVTRLEFVQGSSRKFWEISREGGKITVRYGRIGTQGQTQVKEFADEAKATREMEKLIAEKSKKGYLPVPS